MANLDVDSSFTSIALDENLSTIFLLTTYTMATQISLTSQNMTFVICLRPFKINCSSSSASITIVFISADYLPLNDKISKLLFLQIFWKQIYFFNIWKKHLKEKFTYSLTHHSISVWQFFAYVFYLSVHYFKFVFSPISITHMHTLILICTALDFIYHKVCSSC